MPSKVEIWNTALRLIGETPINSTTEDDDNADILNDIWDMARRAVLRSFPWSFALKTAELANDSSYDAPDFEYAYLQPADCLYVVRAVSPSKTIDSSYTIRANHILTDDQELWIEYVSDDDDPTTYDSLFAEAMAYLLANKIALTRTGKTELLGLMANGFNRAISIARGMNANESRQSWSDSTSILSARN